MTNHEPSYKRIVIIPAYEPPSSFADYAASVLAHTDRLIVVDDGSGRLYRETFDALRTLPNAVVLTNPQNRGKGYALKMALRYCAEHFSDRDRIVTADCDGQHAVQDIGRLFEQSLVHPHALILGCRDFSLPNVPKRSRAGNTNMCRLMQTLYGLTLSDTQTGLRAFTVQTARQLLHIPGDRFEYETNMLLWAKRAMVPIREVPVCTIYPAQEEEHVSHYRTLRDSLRIFHILLADQFHHSLSPRFYSALLRFVRWGARLFSRRYRCDVPVPKQPTVYVCRHLDMHGPYTTLKWLPFDVHPMVLNVFFDQRECTEHFRTYTFSARQGKPPAARSLKASIAGWACTKAVTGLQAVPVYRSSARAMTTLRIALGFLLQGESVIVYPDVDYRADHQTESDIYKGFLFLGEWYRKKTGSSLPFVPLVIDDQQRTLTSAEPVYADRYKTDAPSAAAALKASLYHTKDCQGGQPK